MCVDYINNKLPAVYSSRQPQTHLTLHETISNCWPTQS